MADVPVGALQLAMHASDNIKATTGIFDASLGAQGNETSGRAITARQREGDVGNFHYSDNLHRTQRHAARVIMSGIPFVYDTERVVRLMGEDGKVTSATINQPKARPASPSEQGGAIKAILNNVTGRVLLRRDRHERPELHHAAPGVGRGRNAAGAELSAADADRWRQDRGDDGLARRRRDRRAPEEDGSAATCSMARTRTARRRSRRRPRPRCSR
jgi:hypothetical protein